MIRFRPRLRFSLRTLFVLVTLLCIYVGWQWQIVRERKAVFLSTVSNDPGWAEDMWESIESHDENPRLPWIRRVMGDKSPDVISIWDWNDDDVLRVKNAFPESVVQPGGWSFSNFNFKWDFNGTKD